MSAIPSRRFQCLAHGIRRLQQPRRSPPKLRGRQQESIAVPIGGDLRPASPFVESVRLARIRRKQHFRVSLDNGLDRDHRGEIQVTDALRRLRERRPLYAVRFTGRRFDTGDKLGFLKATVEMALARPDLSEAFRVYLRAVIDGAGR